MKNLYILFFLFPVQLLAQQSQPTEKVHIQTYKTVYQAGDTLYFSAFLWDANDSTVSRVLYVELFSPSSALIGERTLKIENKPVAQYFVLDSAATGTYMLRAYTHYLIGFGNNAFFEKQIQVGTSNHEKAVRIAFEGNSFVEGLPSRLFINTVNSGQSGQIKDDMNNTFASFVSDAEGLAVVSLSSTNNRTYRVELGSAPNDIRVFPLEKPKPSGVTIQIATLDSVVSTKIYAQKIDNDSIITTIYYKGYAVFQQKTVTRSVQVLRLPIKLLPIGLLRYVVTDNKNRFLAERLWFNGPTEGELTVMARYNVLDYYIDGRLPENSKSINHLLNFHIIKTFNQKNNLPKEQNLLRQGVAMDIKNNILKKTELVVWSASKGFGIHSITTDTAGVFEIKNIAIEGLVEIKVQTDDDKLVAVKWLPRQIPPIDATKKATTILVPIGIDVPIIDGRQLEEVVVKAKRNFDKVKTRLGIRYAFADKTIEGSQLLSVSNTSTLRAIQLVYPIINVRSDNSGRDYVVGASVLVNGNFWSELPAIETIARIDIVSDFGNRIVHIYTKDVVNSFDDIKATKPFEGNAFLKGFDVGK